MNEIFWVIFYLNFQHSPPTSFWLFSDKYGCNPKKVFNIDDYFPNASFKFVPKETATLNEIFEHVEEIAQQFNKQDFIIIYAGLYECSCLNVIETTSLKRIFRNLQHTNVILLGVPMTKYPHINDIVADSNNNLKDVCKPFSAVRFIDVNPIIQPFRDSVIHTMKIVYDLILPKVMNDIVERINSLHKNNISSF